MSRLPLAAIIRRQIEKCLTLTMSNSYVMQSETSVQTDVSDESDDEDRNGSDEEFGTGSSIQHSDRDHHHSSDEDDVNIDFTEDYDPPDGHHCDADDEDEDCCCSCKSDTSSQACEECLNDCELCNEQCNNNNSEGLNDSGCHLGGSTYGDEEEESNTFLVKHWMRTGKTVFVRWTDGLYYLGKMERIEKSLGLCLIRYEDNSLYWTHLKDIHTQLSPNSILSDSDIICNECGDGSSKSPNEIVICDVCNQGYHQLCHKPPIPDFVLEPDMPWTCRTCVFTLAAREGGAERDSSIGEAMKMAKRMLHYNLQSLTWNSGHTSNHQNIYCYCGGPGRFNCRMLQCHKCLQWFHEACVQVIDQPMIYGDHFYEFTCAVCGKGDEKLCRVTMKWHDLLSVVIYNLSMQDERKFFDLTTEIVPFIQKNSSKFVMKCNLKKMGEEELSRKILSTLIKYRKRFLCSKDYRKKMNFWALRAVVRSPHKPLIFLPRSKAHKSSKQEKEPPSPAILSQQESPPQPPSSSSSLKTHQQQVRSRSPPSYPLIYGAVRKGASLYPKPAMRRLMKAKSEKSRITSPDSCDDLVSICTPSTSSTEPNIKLKIRANMSDPKNRQHKKHRLADDHGQTPSRRASSSHHTDHSSLNTSNITSHPSSDTSEDEALSTTDTVLEEFIPLPANFEGQNNPFFDMDSDKLTLSAKQVDSISESPTSTLALSSSSSQNLPKVSHDKYENGVINPSEKDNSSSNVVSTMKSTTDANNSPLRGGGYQVIRNETCPKLTLKRVPSNLIDKESHDIWTSSSVSTGMVNRENTPRKCIIKAQRFTSDGKLEYLLEWE